MLKFLKDLNKWVKLTAYKNLGPFISTYEGHIVPDKLLEHYYKMTDPQIIQLGNDIEVYFFLFSY